MINILFLLGLQIASAAEVYEVSSKIQYLWNETVESWRYQKGSTYLPEDFKKVIVYDGFFEIDGRKTYFSSITDDGDTKCYIMRSDWKMCLDRSDYLLYTEKVYKNGQVWLTKMNVELYDGTPVKIGDPKW